MSSESTWRSIVRTALSVGSARTMRSTSQPRYSRNRRVITADRRMLERGRAHGYDVVWLGDVTLRDGVLVDTPQGYQG